MSLMSHPKVEPLTAAQHPETHDRDKLVSTPIGKYIMGETQSRDGCNHELCVPYAGAAGWSDSLAARTPAAAPEKNSFEEI